MPAKLLKSELFRGLCSAALQGGILERASGI